MNTASVSPTGQQRTLSDVEQANNWLETRNAEQRVKWALKNLPGTQVVSTSFGIQSAVMLHLMTRLCPDIPVVLIDTGYLFAETYRFADQLKLSLDLNLKVYTPTLSAAWQEARLGKLWKSGAGGIRRYNRINKVEPMERALVEHQVGTWFSGLRRSQSDTRKDIAILQAQNGAVKVHPIADWSNRDIHRYLREHELPYHPLWDEGYVSIGDHHTSQPLGSGMTEQDTRFFGLVRECGLHEADSLGGTGN